MNDLIVRVYFVCYNPTIGYRIEPFGGKYMSNQETVREVESKKQDNTLGIGWYIAILFLVGLISFFGSMMIGRGSGEMSIVAALSILTGVIACSAVYFAGLLNRNKKD